LVVALIIGVGSVFVALPLVYFLHAEPLRIQDINIQTNGSLASDLLEDTLEEAIAGNILFILPKDSLFFVRPSRLEQELYKRYPRIKYVSITRTGFLSLNVSMIERTPVALWCGDVVPAEAYTAANSSANVSEELNGKCYWMDDQSFIYDRAPLYTGDLYPRYYGPLEHAEPVGQRFIDSDEFARWQDLYVSIEYGGVSAQSILFVDDRDVEVYLDNGVRVLMARSDDTDTIGARLKATLESDVLDLSRPIEYLDLRFGTKAFARYLDGGEEEAPVPEETPVDD
jgi:cell division septal protein FtsQ